MKFWVGVTDDAWFEHHQANQPDEVNFWQPGGAGVFKVLDPGELFLFKLHSPNDFIVGGGYFVRHTSAPVSIAWDAFQQKNGVDTFSEFVASIRKYRAKKQSTIEPDPVIGCIILSQPFFFSRADWIPVPEDWAKNIVRGKTYDSQTETGHQLFEEVRIRLEAEAGALLSHEEEQRYGADYLARARLGQGAFRVLVTDAYHRRCAITGERTLPVLEAAHIKPYAEAGPHRVDNGLLLRSDLHKLFDIGYLTVTPDLHIEVSPRIKEEYENGREYYAHHGELVTNLPHNSRQRPSADFLEWHNENIYVD